MSINSDAREQGSARPWDESSWVPQQRHGAVEEPADVEDDGGEVRDAAVPEADLAHYDEDLTRLDRDLDPAAPHPADVAEPVDSTEPTDSAESTERVEPFDRVDPTEPVDTTDEPVDTVEPLDDAAEPMAEPVAVDDDGAAGTTYASAAATDVDTAAVERADSAAETDSAAEVDSASAGLKPGEATVEPAADLWDGAHLAELRERWRDAQLSFVDDPRAAVDEIRSVVGAAVDAVTSALARQREALDGWHGDGDDTERLRMVVRQYRTFFDRLLDL